jgi:phospholipid/cholesterol/gamma-HCH transport system substrate-binding protein
MAAGMMAENRAEILAGAGVLAVAIGFLVYANRDSGYVQTAGTYPLIASFRSVEGISVGSDIRMAGVKVGTITNLSLNPATFMADAQLQVRSDLALPDDSAIVISSEGLLGGNFVEILPGGSPDNLAPGAEIEDTQGAVSIITLLMKFAGGSGDQAAPDPVAE